MDREEGEVSDCSEAGNSTTEDCRMAAIAVDVNMVDNLNTLAQNLDVGVQITENDLHKLHIDLNLISASEKNIRFDALFIKSDVSFDAKHLLELLHAFRPYSVDPFDNLSCVVVFENRLYATLALLKFSSSIMNSMEDEADLLNVPYHRIINLPEYGRFVVRFAKVTENFIGNNVSFNTDVYQQVERNCTSLQSRLFGKHNNEDGSKNPWGDLSKRWGIFDHQEIYGPQLPPKQVLNSKNITAEDTSAGTHLSKTAKELTERLGKRSFVSDSDEVTSSDSDENWTRRNKIPRMRMRADDEQEKNKQKSKTMHQLTIVESKESFGLTDELKVVSGDHSHKNIGSDIYTRIGARNPFTFTYSTAHSINHSSDGDESVSESSSESEEEHFRNSSFIVSQIQKVHNKTSHSTSVWSRLDDNHNTDKGTDLRARLNKVKIISSDTKNKLDLRKKLQYKKDFSRSPLRIEIDNDYCS